MSENAKIKNSTTGSKSEVVVRRRIAYKAPKLEDGPGILPGMGDLMGWVLGAFLVFVIYTGATQLWSIGISTKQRIEKKVKSIPTEFSLDSIAGFSSTKNNRSNSSSFNVGEDLTPENMQDLKRYLEDSASDIRQ